MWIHFLEILISHYVTVIILEVRKSEVQLYVKETSIDMLIDMRIPNHASVGSLVMCVV